MKVKDPNIRKILEEHQFAPDRGLNDYIELFGFSFANALKALKPMNHWLDSGAGEGRAIREFLLATSKHDIFTTAVTLKMSAKILSPTHKTIVNYLDDVKQETISGCDIITDIEGAIQYSEQPDLLLKKYLLWLKPEAKLFLYVKPETTFISRGSENLGFLEWVSTIPGLSLTPGSEDGAIIIGKEKAGHAVPRLKLLETKVEEKLIRTFREM